MNKKILYYIAALLWGAPGVVIAVKGIQALWKMNLCTPCFSMV